MFRIPPCQASLTYHNERVNHRSGPYKRAHDAMVGKPKPYEEGQGRMKNADTFSVLEPVWSSKPILSTMIIHLLAAGEQGEEESEGNDDDLDKGF